MSYYESHCITHTVVVCFKKVMWLIIMSAGLMMCISHINTSLGRFLKYESQERPSVNKKHRISFQGVHGIIARD